MHSKNKPRHPGFRGSGEPGEDHLQANAAGGDENGGDAQPLSPKAPGGCPPSDVTSACYKVGRIASRGAGS